MYDHNVETKFVDRATHKVYYMLVYYKGGSRDSVVSGRWSDYDKSGISYRKSDLQFYTRPVMSFPPEDAIQKMIQTLMMR